MRMPPPSVRSTAAALALLAWAGPAALGQTDLTVRVAFCAGAATRGPVAFARLGESWLRARPEWPEDLRPDDAFTVTLQRGSLRIARSALTLPPTAVAVASLQFGDGPAALGSCSQDGTEDWFLPAAFVLPAPWPQRLHELQADLLEQPRSLDAAVLAGHLAGPVVDGDPRAALVHLGTLCGEVTFTAWRADSHLRVRGRSDGGLLLPVLVLASLHTAAPSTLSLRAFAARDGDRAEAARQLLRSDDGPATRTLRGLLHADDELRLAAIDTLVRLGAADELPHIVQAAAPAMPLATTAAADAVRALWLAASPAVRQRTRAALAQSRAPDLRRIDPEQLPRRVADRGGEPTVDPGFRARALLALLLSGVAIYGCWLRERARLHPARAARA